jgi:hypothetical protein
MKILKHEALCDGCWRREWRHTSLWSLHSTCVEPDIAASACTISSSIMFRVQIVQHVSSKHALPAAGESWQACWNVCLQGAHIPSYAVRYTTTIRALVSAVAGGRLC